MPDEARDGRNVALKSQLEVTNHLFACLIVQNNHLTIRYYVIGNMYNHISMLKDEWLTCTELYI